MGKLIDITIAAIYIVLVAFVSHYTFEQATSWVQRKALEKASQDLGSMEEMTQRMTDGKLDF